MLTAAQVFPFSRSWSGGFVSFRVMTGPSALDFVYKPLATLGISMLSLFLLYLLCGAVSVLTAILTRREEIALLVSLLFGIAAGLLNMSAAAYDAESNAVRCAVILAAAAVTLLLCLKSVERRDFI
jgi:hypothetical protein